MVPGFFKYFTTFPSQAVRARTERFAPWGGELTLAPDREVNARPRSVTGLDDSRLGQLANARAHQAVGARPRRWFCRDLSAFPSQARGQRLLCCPNRGTSVPLFLCMGRQGRWCPVGTVQRRPSRQARPTPLATPRPWDSVPHPATFEKVDETFTCLYPAFAEGPALAEGEKAA